MRAWLFLASVALLGSFADYAQDAADSCVAAPGAVSTTGDNDLYCIELLPAGDIERASGTARLVPPSSPFGIAVTKAGEPQHDVVFTLRNLPAPASLGKYSVLMAWAATPQLRPGREARGSARRHDSTRACAVRSLPRADHRRIVAASRASRMDGSCCAGRRRACACSRTISRSCLRDSSIRKARPPDHDAHAGPRVTMARPTPAAGEWTPPPMHPEVSMPPAFMSLRPDVSSYLPSPSADAPLARPRELVRMADGDTLTLDGGARPPRVVRPHDHRRWVSTANIPDR